MSDYDTDKVDEAVLALLYLTLHDKDRFGFARAWKGHDWEAMDRLHEKGVISDPRCKAKSVVLDPDGIRAAERAFFKLFGRAQESSTDCLNSLQVAKDCGGGTA